MQLPDGWEFHEVVNLFPEMTAEEFADLKADIAANGLKTEIPVRNGKILDGRHRIKACLELGSNQWLNFLAEYDTDPRDEVQVALTFNLHRRHLTASQKAMIGDDVAAIYKKQAKERQKLSKGRGQKGKEDVPDLKSTQARDAAGKAVGVSGKSIDAANTVNTKGAPELAQAVRSGKVTVTAAAAVAKAVPKEKQVELVRDNKVKEEASRIRKEKKQPSDHLHAAKIAAQEINSIVNGFLKLNASPQSCEPLIVELDAALSRVEASLTENGSGPEE